MKGQSTKEKAVLSTNGGDRVAVNFAKRIVVKVGTSSLTYDNGKMNLGSIDRLCRSIADLNNYSFRKIDCDTISAVSTQNRFLLG